MEAEHLMVGDYVIREDGKIVRLGYANDGITGLDELKPVPLTLKFMCDNFKLDNNKYVYDWHPVFDESTGEITEFYMVIMHNIMGINGYFKYVNQIQHAFELCGINFEFKMDEHSQSQIKLTDEQRIELIAKQIKSSPEKSKQFLIDAGIVTKEGKLSENYK